MFSSGLFRTSLVLFYCMPVYCMVGASANTYFKSVLCFVVFLENLNVLIYIYIYIYIYINIGGGGGET